MTAIRLTDLCAALSHLVSWAERNGEAVESAEMKERLRSLELRIERLAIELQPVERQRRLRCVKYLRRAS